MPSATTTTNTTASKYGPGVQRLPVDAPLADVVALMKRDGGVVIEKFVPHESIDQAYAEIKPKMDADREWKGNFFPGETKRCPGMIGVSKTYTQDQLMHPLYQAVCDHFLTSRNSFWWVCDRVPSAPPALIMISA